MSELNKHRMRYLVGSRSKAFFASKLKPGLRRLLFGSTSTRDISGQISPTRICVPIAAFPFPGGMRSVLAGVAQVMGDQWQMTYLTHRKGHSVEGLEIEIFGLRGMYPWRFPNIWFYCIAGWRKLFTLLRSGPGYDLILPQDGVFTGAFAALVGKMAGVRVVCMDHGNIACLESHTLRMEWIKEIQGYPWYRQVFPWLGYACYWPSLRLLARIATRCADRFLVAGDEVEEVYRNVRSRAFPRKLSSSP